jgi:hypothetical protein
MGWAQQIKDLAKWAKSIDEEVEKAGGMSIVLYRQGMDMRMKNGGPLLEGGWCFGMSVMWIIKTARGESFWDWFKPPPHSCPNLKKPMGSSSDVVEVLRKMMHGDAQRVKLFQLAPAQDKTLGVHIQANNWFAPKITHDSAALRQKAGDGFKQEVLNGGALSELVLKTPGYKLISLAGVKGEHAITARVVDGTVVFMDPNYGEFYFESFASFRKFTMSFWPKYAGLSELVFVTSFTDPEIIVPAGKTERRILAAP